MFALRTFTNYSTSDYNGFRPNPGADSAFEWDSPPAAVAADYTIAREVRQFKTLAEFARHRGRTSTVCWSTTTRS